MYCKFDFYLITTTFITTFILQTKQISIKDTGLVIEVFEFKTFLCCKRQDYRISMLTSFLQSCKKFNLILILSLHVNNNC